MIVATLTQLFLTLSGLFLIFIILLQRGRGGGLTGALGGMGGQSAFGTKAGDVFTKITVGLAVAWVVLNCASIFANRAAHDVAYGGREGQTQTEVKGTETEGEASTETGVGETPAAESGSGEKAVKPEGEEGETPASTEPTGEKTETPAAETPADETSPEKTPEKPADE